MRLKPNVFAYITVMLVLLFSIRIVEAQCPNKRWDTSNVGAAYVDESGNKAIYGNFTNTTSSQYVNDGRLYLFGDIRNDGFLGDGFGYEYIKACDNTITTIEGRGTTEFNRLNVNNPIGVRLEQLMSVKTILQFAGGIIHSDRSNPRHKTIFLEGAAHSGASDKKHIDGVVTKIGSGPFSFPLGDGDHLSQLKIRGQNSFDEFTSTYISKNLDFIQQISKGVYPSDQKDFNILEVQDKEFWTLDGLQSTTVTLFWTFYSDIMRITSNTEDLVVVGWDEDKWVNLGKTDKVEIFGTGTLTSRSVVPDEYDAYTFGVLDSDGDLFADSKDIERFNPCVPDPSSEACANQMCVQVETGVWLEGALYRDGVYSDMMSTRLNGFGYLPGQKPKTLLGVATDPGQPYDAPPWRYTGSEGEEIDEINNIINSNVYPDDAVDWVLLSLRTGTDEASTVCTKAALVLSNGDIMMTEYFDCCNLDNQEFYLVIEHRNHLAVMTPTPIQVVDGLLSFDFRTNQSYTALLGYQQKEVAPDKFVMYAGNGDQFIAFESSRDINASDNGLWAKDNGKHSGYYFQDYDLNGDVNVHDKALWILNNGVFTDVEPLKF